ncbi:MAG: threonine--tRNA ligase, partial [Patescibacteria group bacterium]
MQNENQMEELNAMRHTAAHLLAAAVKDLWPGTHNAIGPAIEDGFYQDFDFGDRVISEEDFPKIEKRMRELLKSWESFTERSVSAEEARKLFAENPYKLELVEDFAREGKDITVNDPGNFLDLCKGGHVEKPSKQLKHFKLLSLAGAYWRGDEKNQMLTRIYGTAFAAAEELDEFLKMKEEAKKRDHRKLGQALDLFTFSPLVGSGLPLFTPRGTIIRDELERFLWSLQTPRGFLKVNIPHLAKPELYKISGHWDKFADNLFHVRGKGDEEFVVKPMNCPHHTQIYASRPRSYKELPLRLAEVTTIYRDEQAGELLGLSRVRSITQDDAHIFCRPDQIREEIGTVMKIIQQFYAGFDFEHSIRLSLSDPANPEAYLGTREIWDMAEGALRQELKV